MICLHLFCNSECQSVEWVQAPTYAEHNNLRMKNSYRFVIQYILINKTAKNSTIDVTCHFHSFAFCPSIAIFIISTHYRRVRLSQPSNRPRYDNKKTKNSSKCLNSGMQWCDRDALITPIYPISMLKPMHSMHNDCKLIKSVLGRWRDR